MDTGRSEGATWLSLCLSDLGTLDGTVNQLGHLSLGLYLTNMHSFF